MFDSNFNRNDTSWGGGWAGIGWGIVTIAAFSWGLMSSDKKSAQDALGKKGEAIEVVVKDNTNNTLRKDTVVYVPLDASKEFRNAVYPLIKEGKLKVVKNIAPTP